MDEVQVIPFSGKTLELDFGGAGNVRFPSSDHGFLLGRENAILEPLLQEILHGNIAPERQPILLYGILGSGRTHLLKGILETWWKKQTNESTRRLACYSTCADFARHFTQSITTKTTDEFRRRYQRAKLILLDDLEQLFGKPAAQMELRLLLDAFATGEGVIVMTAQTLPADKAADLPADLVARIQGGTAIHVLPPGEAVRRRFLQSLALALQIPCPETSLQTTAKELTGTIPRLYAAVVQKYMEAKAAGEPLDSTFWQQFFRKLQSHSSQDIAEIVKRTAAYFSLKPRDLRGQSRSKTIALARSLTVYLVKTQTTLTFKEIGHFFGKRDPSSIRYLFEKVRRDLQTVPELRDHLFRLEQSQR
jgi:chromosomal replication initiator protein